MPQRDGVLFFLLELRRFLFPVLVVLCIVGCSSIDSKRHKPSGRNSTFSFNGDRFEDYIGYSRQLIEETRTDFTPRNRDELVEGNSPFVLLPPRGCPRGKSRRHKRGILLAHGLTDSPYTMRAVARFFQNECFYVQSLLLPGHGTRPGDLLEVTRDEWVKAYSFGVSTLKESVDEVYLGGLSTGGTLAIHRAMNDGDIRALFLFSPAVEITKVAGQACWLASLDSIFPRMGWLGPLQPDEDPFKYESFPANAACQIYRLIREIERARKAAPLAVPLFIAASDDDATVHTSATIDLFKNATSSNKKMILYSRREPEDIGGIEVMDSRLPKQHIVSSAHTAVVIPPEDDHYGADGRYAFCAHYYKKDDRDYATCKERQEDLIGEISDEFQKQGVVRRLTYNPHYTTTLERMRDFIAALP
jgi:esterase/lipase